MSQSEKTAGQAPEVLSIRAVTAITGVNAVTLRAWERRYGLIKPPRTPKGHRLYTHQHVEQIQRVLALVERGVPMSQVAHQLETSPARATDTPWAPYQERMAAAITRFDESELDLVCDEALSVHSIEQVTTRLMLPLLARMGERWKDVAGGVAEEHFFATYLRSKLGSRLLHRLRYEAHARVLAACGPGEHHEIGLLLFALEAQAAGLAVVVLGADTPFAEIAEAQKRARCAAVVVSSSLDLSPQGLEKGLPALVEAAQAPVFVGGRAAARQRKAIAAAGAVPLGGSIEDAVRLLKSTIVPRVRR